MLSPITVCPVKLTSVSKKHVALLLMKALETNTDTLTGRNRQ